MTDEGTTAYSGPSPVARDKSSQPTQWAGPLIGLGSSSATKLRQPGGGGEGSAGGGEGGGVQGGGVGGAGGSGGDEGGGCGAKHMVRLKACSSPELFAAAVGSE